MDASIRQKLAKSDLREIISLFESPQNIRYVGRRMYVKCWFHKEKTPSMHILEHGFYCFGCGAKGGIKEILEKVLPANELPLALQEYKKAKRLKNSSFNRFSPAETVNWEIVMLAHDLLTLNTSPNITKVRDYLTKRRCINPLLVSYPIGYYNGGLFFPQIVYSDVIAKAFNIFYKLPVTLGGKIRLIEPTDNSRWITLQGTKESIPYEMKASNSTVLAITEGLTDAIALMQFCNVYGFNWHVIASSSIVQMEKIVFNTHLLQKKQMIIVFTDEDKIGLQTRDKIRKIAADKGITKIILPSLTPFKDVAEMLEKNTPEFPNLIKRTVEISNTYLAKVFFAP